jgi:hypothetical protein
MVAKKIWIRGVTKKNAYVTSFQNILSGILYTWLHEKQSFKAFNYIESSSGLEKSFQSNL